MRSSSFTGLVSSTHCLRRAGRVGSVGGVAEVAEHPGQAAMNPEGAGLDRAQRDTKSLGDLGLGEPLEMLQADQLRVIGIQGADGPADLPHVIKPIYRGRQG